MKGRWTAFALTMGLTAAPALVSAQDHAVPRGGGGGGGSSSAGSHHSGGGSSSSSSGSSSSSSSSGSSSDSSSSTPQTDAQRRHPRPGTGTGDHYSGGHNYYYYGSPYYYSRNYYYDAFDPFLYGAYGYSPFYYSGSYGYTPYYYNGRYSDSGSLRVIVDPEKTRVYVDNYYAGIADDFDGIFQRLSVPPGQHEITLKLDGYRTHTFRVYVPPGETLKLHHAMERGAGADTNEVVGEAPANYGREDRDRDPGRDARDRVSRTGGDDAREDEPDDAEAGTLHLGLNPSDASVYVDGEFRGSGSRVENLRLAPGRHRIEVVRPGYRTVEREIDVRAGETSRVEFDLGR
jgi:hypothetical protein